MAEFAITFTSGAMYGLTTVLVGQVLHAPSHTLLVGGVLHRPSSSRVARGSCRSLRNLKHSCAHIHIVHIQKSIIHKNDDTEMHLHKKRYVLHATLTIVFENAHFNLLHA